MPLLVLSYILVLAIGYAAGWFERDVRVRMKIMAQGIVALINNKAEKPEEPSGKLVEPFDDPVAEAKAEFEARSRKLNE